MGSLIDRRKCRCCNDFFRPDCHKSNRQFYCSAPDCRRASKAASQRRWLQEPVTQNPVSHLGKAITIRGRRKPWLLAMWRKNQHVTHGGGAISKESLSVSTRAPGRIGW